MARRQAALTASYELVEGADVSRPTLSTNAALACLMCGIAWLGLFGDCDGIEIIGSLAEWSPNGFATIR